VQDKRMTSSPLDTYLAGLDPRAAAQVSAVDSAVRGAHPGFDVAIKYRLLTYALDGDWRTWVCAINAGSRGVALRFLYGVLLEDPLGVLRPGSSVLMTWDIGYDDALDLAGIGAYVQQAVGRYPQYKATHAEVLARARARARAAASRPGRAPAG
jgi:hypothetical protein